MMMMTKQMRSNSNIFEDKKDSSAYRLNDAASNHKQVGPIPKINQCQNKIFIVSLNTVKVVPIIGF